MKKIIAGLITVSSVSAYAAINVGEIKTCENGDASPSMCIQLHQEFFKKGEMPTLRDNVPMRCFVSKKAEPPSARYYDAVTKELGNVFKATLRLKTFNVEMGGQTKTKTVGYLIYDRLNFGAISGDEGLASTIIDWRPRQNSEYQGEVQFYREHYDSDSRSKYYVYNWVTEYQGKLLLKEQYFENYAFNLYRSLSCVEIKE